MTMNKNNPNLSIYDSEAVYFIIWYSHQLPVSIYRLVNTSLLNDYISAFSMDPSKDAHFYGKICIIAHPLAHYLIDAFKSDILMELLKDKMYAFPDEFIDEISRNVRSSVGV